MSNRTIIILVLVIIGATAWLLLKSDGNIDMGGEKHGADALRSDETKVPAPITPTTENPANPKK